MSALRKRTYSTVAAAGLSFSSAFGATINVDTVSELHAAFATANDAGGNTTILVADGIYTLNDTLYVNAPNVTIAGASGDRDKVIIQGDAMSANARVGNLIRVAGSGFELRDLTLRRSGYHLIQIVGEANADSPRITDCVLRDAYQQMLKVSVDQNNLSVSSDSGWVEGCLFEYTAGIGPQYYIGGIDAHAAKNWTVRNNTFRNIASPSGSVAEFAVHFWNGSANNTVERNLIIDCDRGIGFGMDGRGNSSGVIRNNMIYHSANGSAFADTGISLIESPNSRVYNNTVYMANSFPWAIEYRFASTTGVVIANNLTNKAIQSRDGASGSLNANVLNATSSWFVDAGAGNLRLSSPHSSVVDKGQSISGLVEDFDGQARPAGSGIDIGADEFSESSTAVPRPPTDLQAI